MLQAYALMLTRIVVVRRQPQVIEKIIGNSLLEVAPVYIERKEHHAGPERHVKIQFALQLLLFLLCPLQVRIESFAALVSSFIVNLAIGLRDDWVEERVGFQFCF